MHPIRKKPSRAELTAQLCIRLEPEMRDDLNAVCAEQGHLTADVIRSLIAGYILEHVRAKVAAASTESEGV